MTLAPGEGPNVGSRKGDPGRQKLWAGGLHATWAGVRTLEAGGVPTLEAGCQMPLLRLRNIHRCVCARHAAAQP